MKEYNRKFFVKINNFMSTSMKARTDTHFCFKNPMFTNMVTRWRGWVTYVKGI